MGVIAPGRTYGILIDEDDIDLSAEEGVWGFECFDDGSSSEKRMDDIIITAANYHAARSDGYHFSWMGILQPSQLEKDGRRPKDD